MRAFLTQVNGCDSDRDCFQHKKTHRRSRWVESPLRIRRQSIQAFPPAAHDGPVRPRLNSPAPSRDTMANVVFIKGKDTAGTVVASIGFVGGSILLPQPKKERMTGRFAGQDD